MSSAHTPGPWRWEFNRESKIVHLVGGRPKYDLTIMDFDRWGMHRAVPNLRDTDHDGMNIMHRLCDRADWIAPFKGREHHASWCADGLHPDMRLIAAAPDLLEALRACAMELGAVSAQLCSEGWSEGAVVRDAITMASTAIAKATGGAA